MPGWISGLSDKAAGAKPAGVEVVHLIGYDEFGKLYLAAAQDSGVKASVQKFTATAEQFLQTQVDDALGSTSSQLGGAPGSLSKGAGNSWASNGAEVVKEYASLIRLALLAVADLASFLSKLSPSLGEIVKKIAETGADFVKTFMEWFEEKITNGLGLYLTTDMADALFDHIVANKNYWVKTFMLAFASNRARAGFPYAEAYYGIVAPGDSKSRAAKQAWDGYQLPFSVWQTLKVAGIPAGVAACPALHLEYVVLKAQYANNPSFREMAAGYVGGYSAAQAKEVKLTELWPLVSNKWLAQKTGYATGGAGTVKPDKAKIEQAVKVAVSAFERYGGSAYDKWVNFKKDDEPLPYVQPAALTNHDLAVYAAIACQGYYLTPMQEVRVDCTKDGYAKLGFAIGAAGGLPGGMVSQAGLAPQVPGGGTIDGKGNVSTQLQDNPNKLGVTTEQAKPADGTALVVGGVAAAVVVGVLV